MDTYLGTIIAVAFDFAPRGYLPCDGKLLPIQQNTALFSLIGTRFGGDGISNFALPDLRGRAPVGAGQGPGIDGVELGMRWGVNSATQNINGRGSASLAEDNLPKHTHPVTISGDAFSVSSTLHANAGAVGATAPSEGATLAGAGPGRTGIYAGGATPDTALNAGSVTTKFSGDLSTATGANAGNGTPFEVPFNAIFSTPVMQPSLGILYCICVEGIFPSRS